MKYLLGGVLIFSAVLLIISLTMGDKSTKQTALANNLTELPTHSVDPIRPTEIVELADGDTYNLEATIVQQGVGNRVVKRLAYNGQIPGPVLKVQKGSNITINFTNNIDMETALHSHGLRGDWRFDGAVPITPAVEVGETFSYQLEFPDEGVYWYHPHVREDYQQELGLYGNMIVEGDSDYWNPVEQEEYLILDDILEDGDFARDTITHTLMGRFGDTLLINDQENYSLKVKQGVPARLFVTNVANTRTFDLSLPNAQMKLVGGDNGRIEHEVMVDDVIMGTSERYIVEVLYSKPGTYPIMHRDEQIGEVVVAPSTKDESLAFADLRDNSVDYAEYRSQVDTLLARSADKNLRLDIEMRGRMMGMLGEMDGDTVDTGMMGGGNGMMGSETGERGSDSGMMMDIGDDAKHGDEGIEWEDEMPMMNSASNDKMIEWVIEDTDTGDKNDDINWSFKKGDMIKVRIFNDPDSVHPMQHPIHFHGQRFVVLERDGTPNDNFQWKDTTLVRTGETIDILVDMSNPGKWMAHCHIAEHLHSGMMFTFDVLE